ncbi:MAG: HAMP domain-containing histidine kinase [Candidatus Riflebacteria bacterium]|nr:HAMP domain-containing histidine kinase [Candidatus Riflebacteria bacterium]
MAPINKDRVHASRWYYAAAGFAFLSLAILAWVAFQAIGIQAFEEAEKQTERAAERVHEALKAIVGSAHLVFSNTPKIKISRDTSLLQDARPFPVDEEKEILLKAAISKDSAENIYWESLINAEIDRRPFWTCLLINIAWEKSQIQEMENRLIKYIDKGLDLRLGSGFSLKSLMILKCCERLIRIGKIDNALKLLIKAGEQPQPLQSQEDLQKDSGTIIKSEISPWYRAILYVWYSGRFDINSSKELWPPFSYYSGGQRFIIPWPIAQDRLVAAAEKSAGADFRVSFVPADFSGAANVPENPEIGVKVVRIGTSGSGRKIFWLLILGFALAIGLTGFSVLLVAIVNREQEKNVFKEQEWFYRQAAHDLKTPLASLRAMVETLQLGRISSKEQERRYFSRIISELDRSLEMVDSMLMIARIRGGFLTLHPKEIDLKTQIDLLIERFKPRLESWKIIVDIKADLYIFADQDVFERVFVNLIENVLRHAADGRTLEIKARFLPEEENTEITVSDNGPGFLKVTESLRKSIGLSLVQASLEAHKSVFRIENRQGGGASVITQWNLNRGSNYPLSSKRL